MPEGHTVHRLASRFAREFRGDRVAASSPQGRFAAGAALLDGLELTATEAHGKQMFLGFGPDRWLRVHLGLYGKWTFGSVGAGPDAGPPPPRGALRVRLVGGRSWADLRGPTACEVVDDDGKAQVQARLGPDPLRRDGDADRFAARVLRSRAPVATLLMDQPVVAGVGNVYRAEVLFRAGTPPLLPGRELPPAEVLELWADLGLLLRDGVRRGRIVTTEPADRTPGRIRREDAHYVYRRDGLPCRRCRAAVVRQLLAGRNLFWCPVCQAG